MGLLIRNIKGLVQVEDDPKIMVCGKDMAVLNIITDAYLFLENGLISDFGIMSDLNKADIQRFKITDEILMLPENLFFLPSAIHIHTLFMQAAVKQNSRIRSKGLSYEEIAKQGRRDT